MATHNQIELTTNINFYAILFVVQFYAITENVDVKHNT